MRDGLRTIDCQPTCPCERESIPFAGTKRINLDFSDVITSTATSIRIKSIVPVWKTPQMELTNNVVEVSEFFNDSDKIVNYYKNSHYDLLPQYQANTKQLADGLEIALEPGMYFSVRRSERGEPVEYLQYSLLKGEPKLLSDLLDIEPVPISALSNNSCCYGINTAVEFQVTTTPKLTIGHQFRVDVYVEILDCNCNPDVYKKCIILTVTDC